MPAKKVPSSAAIFAVDPGGTTGVSRGEFNLGLGTVASVWQEAETSGRAESWEIEGDELDQALEIAGEFADWYGDLRLAGWAETEIHFVWESFELRQLHADLAPVRVGSMVRGLLWRLRDREWIDQSPSMAKTYATNDRLKRWGAWVKGSDHRRDANRHVLLRIATLLGDSE